ncbi:hypothetical protein [Clostridium sp. KNHs205]|uniref:hypothetical protein n=1 Tax=Clostridium sp. KNHs205 TaxID=1449050 RepID=UPI000AB0045E|nr:hypothetical protein [Clostridium sp. KNHs205]
MRVLLVDDEELALDVLQRLLMQIDGIEVVGKFTNPFMALEELSVIEADAVFWILRWEGYMDFSLPMNCSRKNCSRQLYL